MSVRKHIIGILAAVLVLSLCGCNAGEAAVSGDFRAVGMCVRNQAESSAYYDALVASIKELGCGVLLEDCRNDQSRQNEKVSHMISQGCTLLVVEPVMVTALESVIDQAKQAQIPVVILDRKPEDAVMSSYEKLYYVGCNIAGAGTLQAQLLETLNLRGDLNEDGVVSCMMLRGPEDHLDAQLITDGCNQALEQTEAELLCTVSAQWTMEDARAQCAQALSQYGRDIEVIFCNDAQLTLGAVEAVKNGGWVPGQDVYIMGVGTNGQIDELIAQGAVAATVAADVQQRVGLVKQTVEMLLAGENPQTCSYVDYSTIVPET